VLLISHDRDFLDRLVSGVIAPEGDGHWTEYAGGYSDMLAQRGADLTRAQAGRPPPKQTKELAKQSAKQPASLQPAKRRMSFKDKHALETLPKTMAALIAKSDALQAKLVDAEFYRRDRAGFEKVTSDLAETQRKLAAAEEHWLALEILREEIVGS